MEYILRVGESTYKLVRSDSLLANMAHDPALFQKAIPPKGSSWEEIAKDMLMSAETHNLFSQVSFKQALAKALIKRRLGLIFIANIAHSEETTPENEKTTLKVDHTQIYDPKFSVQAGVLCSNYAARVNGSAIPSPQYQDLQLEKCHVSVNTGEVILARHDFTLNGPIVFKFFRYYRSGLEVRSDFGKSWCYQGYQHLKLLKETFEYHCEQGRVATLKIPEIGQTSVFLPDGLIFERTHRDRFKLFRQDKPTDIFTRFGMTNTFKLTQTQHNGFQEKTLGTEENGFCISYIYGAMGELLRIETNWGQAVTFTRDPQNLITDIRQINLHSKAIRQLARFQYDDNQRQTMAINQGQGHEHFNYHKNTPLLTDYHCDQTEKTVYEWHQDQGMDRCKESSKNNYHRYFTYALQPEKNTTLLTKVTDTANHLTQWHMNNYGQVEKNIDALKQETTYEFSDGVCINVYPPSGNATSLSYNNTKWLTGIRWPENTRYAQQYFKNKLSKTTRPDNTNWQYQYNDNGLLICLIDPTQQKYTVSYNNFGLPAEITDPIQRVYKLRWNNLGQLTILQDVNGYQQHFRYNHWGEVIERLHVTVDLKTAKPVKAIPLFPCEKFKFNAFGSLCEFTSNHFNLRLSYNNFDDCVKEETPQYALEFKYNALKQLVGITTQKHETIAFNYNEDLNLSAIINERGESANFKYNATQSLVEEIGFDGRSLNYFYNQDNALFKVSDANVFTYTFERDIQGRLIHKHCRHNKTQEENTVTFSYDTFGRIVSATNDEYHTDLQYSTTGNLSSETTFEKNTHGESQTKKNTVAYTNIWPNIIKKIQTPEFNVAYTLSDSLDTTGLETSLGASIRTQKDTDNRFKQTFNNNVLIESFNESGKKESTLFQSSGNVIHHYFDSLGFLFGMRAPSNNAQIKYDDHLRISKLQLSTHKASKSIDIEYDVCSNSHIPISQPQAKHQISEGNRLKEIGEYKLAYDKKGNIVEKYHILDKSKSIKYQFNCDGLLGQCINQRKIIKFEYDALGRRQKKIADNNETNYLWHADKLYGIENNDQYDLFTYAHDSFTPCTYSIHTPQSVDNKHYYTLTNEADTPTTLVDYDGNISWNGIGIGGQYEPQHNSFSARYSGYFYDKDSELYLGLNRQYAPDIDRFISQSDNGLMASLNTYAFAQNKLSENNPLANTQSQQSFDWLTPAGRQQHFLRSENILHHCINNEVLSRILNPHSPCLFNILKNHRALTRQLRKTNNAMFVNQFNESGIDPFTQRVDAINHPVFESHNKPFTVFHHVPKLGQALRNPLVRNGRNAPEQTQQAPLTSSENVNQPLETS